MKITRPRRVMLITNSACHRGSACIALLCGAVMDMESLVSILDVEQLDKLKAAIKSEKQKRRVKRRRMFTSQFDPRHYKTKQEANQAILKINSSNLLEPPERSKPLWHRMKYLPALIAQDWSETYPEKGGRREFYVYAHVDPREWVVTIPGANESFGGSPFYIGKGVGNRAFDLKRNQGHGKYLRTLFDAGYESQDIVKIAFDGLTESKAYEIESKLVCFFGTVYEEGKKGMLMNLEVPKTPEWVGSMQKPMCRQRWNAASA